MTPPRNSSRLRRWTIKITLALLAGAVVTWGVSWGCALWSPLGYVMNGGVELSPAEAEPWLATLPPQSPDANPWHQVVPPPGPYFIRTVVRFEKSGFGLRTTVHYMQVRDDRPELMLQGGGGLSVGEELLDWRAGRKSTLKLPKEIPRFTTEPLGTVATYEAGWPMPSLSFTRRVTIQLWKTAGFMTLEGGVPPPRELRPAAITYDRWAGVSERALPLRVLPLGFAVNAVLAAGAAMVVIEGVRFAYRQARRRKGRCPSCSYDRFGIDAVALCPECGRGA